MSEGGGDIRPSGDRMPGEPGDPRSSAEAHRWIQMYDQLVKFEEKMLARMEGMQKELPTHVQEEVQLSNIQPMRELIQKYRRRVQRLEQVLITIVPDEEPTREKA